jgi:hypothetical protein
MPFAVSVWLYLLFLSLHHRNKVSRTLSLSSLSLFIYTDSYSLLILATLYLSDLFQLNKYPPHIIQYAFLHIRRCCFRNHLCFRCCSGLEQGPVLRCTYTHARLDPGISTDKVQQLPCFATAVQGSGCSLADTKCQCTTGLQTIQSSLLQCAPARCSADDLTSMCCPDTSSLRA